MTDPNLEKIVGVTDDELRFASRHLAAGAEAMRQSRHFASGSEHLALRMLGIEISIRELHKDINFIRTIAAAPANQAGHVETSSVTQRPDGTYEQHSHGRFSGPLHNAQNTPKPETP